MARNFVKEKPGTGLGRMSKEKAVHYGARGAMKANCKTLIYIGDEIVTYEDIARKLNVCKSTVEKRVARIRKSGQPITWESLGYGQE